MHRLLVTTEILEAEVPTLPSAAAKHLKVLRPESGERLELFDGHGHTRQYVWREGALSAASNLQTRQPSNHSLTLFACITKGSRWDWTLEKATELGVTRIVPVISDRTIVRIPSAEREAKRERWLRIAEDAARQSDAVWLPEILPATDFKAALAMVAETTCFVGALTNPPSPSLASAVNLNLAPQPHLSLFIGPEGDFTPDELTALLKIAIPTSFGPTILRAETAALYAISVVQSLMCDAVV